jgi:hypothetical protein
LPKRCALHIDVISSRAIDEYRSVRSALTASGGTMRQTIYAMQFTGTGSPGDDGNLHASTSSPSTIITSAVNGGGLSGSIRATDGEQASFVSTVTMTGDTSFTEVGTITFGDGNQFDFSTVGEGYIGPSPEDGLMHGVVSWRLENGQGQFADASGLITSNFTLSAEGAVTDQHFGVLWLA